MPKRDLKLNALPRFAKNSAQFVLEEHSHCEVPAGCGGVVLRWRNPNDGIPLLTWMYAASTCQIRLDGIQPSSARPIVPWGRHAWAFTYTEINTAHALLSFAALHQAKETHIQSKGAQDEPYFLLSKPDGSWKYTLSEPAGDAWMLPDFDDSSWLAMELKELNPAALDKLSRDRWRLTQLERIGAEPLGINETSERVWIRKTFSLAPNSIPSPKP